MVEDAASNGTQVGAAIVNRDNNPHADIVVMVYDAKQKHDHYRFKIGWNLDAGGRAARWDTTLSTIAGFSLTGYGAGIVLVNIDNDPRPDLLVMTFDNSKAENPFRYDVVKNFGLSQSIHVEMDKLKLVDWPSDQVTRNGALHSLATIYSPLGISITSLQDEDDITDLNRGKCYSDAELDSFLVAHMHSGPSNPNAWHMYAAFVTCHLNPTSPKPPERINDRLLGIIFDRQERRGIAVFMNQLASSFPGQDSQQYVMRTTAHELGHALCLHHIDGDAHRDKYTSGRTIMNQSQYLTNDWNYAWSAPVFHRIYNYPRSFWKPGSGIPFMSCRTFQTF